MTAAEIIAEVREYGGDVALMPDRQRLLIEHRSRIPDKLAAEAKAHVEELCTMLLAEPESVALAENVTGTVIRERRFPTSCPPAACCFHIGQVDALCRRCGASWMGDYSFGKAKHQSLINLRES